MAESAATRLNRLEPQVEKIRTDVNANENNIIELQTKLGNGCGLHSRISALEAGKQDKEMCSVYHKQLLAVVEELKNKGRNDWLKVKDIILVVVAVGGLAAAIFL